MQLLPIPSKMLYIGEVSVRCSVVLETRFETDFRHYYHGHPTMLSIVPQSRRSCGSASCLGVPKFSDTVGHMPGINDDLPISRSRMRVAHTPSQLLNHAGSSWILGVSDDANRLYKGATADPAPPLCRGGVPPTNRRQCSRLHCQAD